MKTHWNGGMDYGFSAIKKMMWLVGVWPLQQNDLACTFRWILAFINDSFTVMGLLIDYFLNCGDIEDNLEFFLIVHTCFHAWVNTISARIYIKKVAINVNSAIDDWSLSMEKQSYVIMMGYARLGRLLTMSHLVICSIAAPIYYISVFGNPQQVVIIGNDTTNLWNFVIPSSCLFKGISYSTYNAILFMQVLQGFIIFLGMCANDIFFFAITMHLCGQIELLRIRFVEIERKIADKNNYRNSLKPWIKRHNKLIMLAKNIEDSFNFNLLIHLSIITIVIAVSGVRIIVSVQHQNYTDAVKSMCFIQFSLMQSFMFTHAGDTLRNQSESIFLAISDSTWHKFSPNAMKALVFLMMKTKIPLQLTAGKFFYITRSTITDILKTALTYVSFLQVTMAK